MGLLPTEEQMTFGVIIQGEGVTIYLDGGNDLQVILDKIERKGVEILVPKTLHADESGYFALFIDTEGNRLGLHSPK